MPPKPLVLFAASEIFPFSKSGGLGDVLGALPLKLHEMGVNTAVVTPMYGKIGGKSKLHLVYSNLHIGYPWEPITADVYRADHHGMPVYFIQRDEFYDRRWYYNTYNGDYFDNCERFIFFCRAALEWCKHLEAPPAIIHAHDWQTGLIPAYLDHWSRGDLRFRGMKSVFTIHNLAFQGRFASRLFAGSGLPADSWGIDGVEYYGDLNCLKAGIAYADKVTTVSPGYAEEILTDQFGEGLQGILRKRQSDLIGVLNGADYTVWDPQNDKYLPAKFSPGDLSGKKVCKENLIAEMGLNPFLVNRPILGFVGRLREQKGVDLLIDIFRRIILRDVGIVVLGEGGQDFEEALLHLMEDYPLRLAANIGYTEDLAHRIQAGVDLFLMPSRYEPCGLTQMYALRYGAVPVVTAVGGLKDTILSHPHPQATGFTFQSPDPESFYNAVSYAVDVWETDPNAFAAVRDRAMRQTFSWDDSAAHYIDIYNSLGAGLPG